MVKRIIALSVIFIFSWIAWGILTFVIHVRTDEKSTSTGQAVGQLWGDAHSQTAPKISATWNNTTKRDLKKVDSGWEYCEHKDTLNPKAQYDTQIGNLFSEKIEQKQLSQKIVLIKKEDTEDGVLTGDGDKTKTKRENATLNEKKKKKGKKGEKGDEDEPELAVEETTTSYTTDLPLLASKIDVDLDVEYRKKGLLWHSLYAVKYGSAYTVKNPSKHPIAITMKFRFPSNSAIYDNMGVWIDGIKDLNVTAENGHMVARFSMPGNTEKAVKFGYNSRGRDIWKYRFGTDVNIIKNLNLTMNTNFDEIDFPLGTISPDKKIKNENGAGYKIIWNKQSLVSGQMIGMSMPHKINPGPLAQEMCLHAPVSLFFFFFVIFMFQIIRNIQIHPVNYFFIAASFFAFNLLFSYLADQLPLAYAFAISSVTSIFLVVSYMRLVVSSRFALLEAGISQLVFQVLFSLAHFNAQYTGLTITVGAIVTLAIVMRLTAHIDWKEVFAAGKKNKIIEPEMDSVTQSI